MVVESDVRAFKGIFEGTCMCRSDAEEHGNCYPPPPGFGG